MNVEVAVLLLFLFKTCLSDHDTEYRITITISEEVHDTYYERYKPLYVTIKGNLGETKEHECPRNYNPASSVTCAVKDQISIGKFMCLAFGEKKGKNTWGAQITFTRLRVDVMDHDDVKTHWFVPDKGFEEIYRENSANEYCFDKIYPTGFPQEAGWFPHRQKGSDPLDAEYGFFYWLFQTFVIPPLFVLLIGIFGIIACIRGKVCRCCNRRNSGYGNHPIVTVQAP